MPAAVPGTWPSRWTFFDVASGSSAGASAADAATAFSATAASATASVAEAFPAVARTFGIPRGRSVPRQEADESTHSLASLRRKVDDRAMRRLGAAAALLIVLAASAPSAMAYSTPQL